MGRRFINPNILIFNSCLNYQSRVRFRRSQKRYKLGSPNMVCVISHNPRQRAVAVIFDPKSERSMPQCQKECKRVMRSLSASLPVRYRGIKVIFQAPYRMWRRWFQRLADGRGRGGAACCVNMLSSPCIV